jgi:hypothetical protein
LGHCGCGGYGFTLGGMLACAEAAKKSSGQGIIGGKSQIQDPM